MKLSNLNDETTHYLKRRSDTQNTEDKRVGPAPAGPPLRRRRTPLRRALGRFIPLILTGSAVVASSEALTLAYLAMAFAYLWMEEALSEKENADLCQPETKDQNHANN